MNSLFSLCGASGLFFPSSKWQKSCFPTCLMLRWMCHPQQQKGESRDEDMSAVSPLLLMVGQGINGAISSLENRKNALGKASTAFSTSPEGCAGGFGCRVLHAPK